MNFVFISEMKIDDEFEKEKKFTVQNKKIKMIIKKAQSVEKKKI